MPRVTMALPWSNAFLILSHVSSSSISSLWGVSTRYLSGKVEVLPLQEYLLRDPAGDGV